MSDLIDIAPFEKNPRKLTKQRRKDLLAWIEEFGDLSGIVVNVRTGESISGNQRCKVIKVNKCERHIVKRLEEPNDVGTVAYGYVIYQGERFNYREVDWDEETAKRANVIANSAGGEWDFDMLADEFDFDDLKALGMEPFLPGDFGAIQDHQKDERLQKAPEAKIDQAAELRKKWKTEPGQLWLIPSLTVEGKAHRLMCGDSTSADDVQRLMGDERAILFATDPPYLVDYTGDSHPDNPRTVEAGSYQDWDRADANGDLYDGFVSVAIEHALLPNAAWYCWHASKRQGMLEEVWTRHGAFVNQQIIWVKSRPVMTRNLYLWGHEVCFFGWIRGSEPPVRSHDKQSTVWTLDSPGKVSDTLHPTSKPLEVFSIPMDQHTRKGEICYEPFSGSGSQHAAGEAVGRLVYGMEQAPEYCAVILERLSEMGLEPELTPDQ